MNYNETLITTQQSRSVVLNLRFGTTQVVERCFWGVARYKKNNKCVNSTMRVFFNIYLIIFDVILLL